MPFGLAQPDVPADQTDQGRRHRSFALVNSAALGNGYWQY
jgi:hypothetical protein